MTNLRYSTVQWIVPIGLLCLIAGIPIPVQSVDFGSLPADTESMRSTSENQSLLNYRKTLWRGQPDDLLFEVTTLNQSLVWISATNNKLHVNEGDHVNPYPGSVSLEVPGEILAMDVNSMPHLESKILISLTLLQGNQLISKLVSYNGSTDSLTPYYQSRWKALRPLDGFLYGQPYSAEQGWGASIYRLQTTADGYRRSESSDLPTDAVLLHMTRLPSGATVYLDEGGDLRLARGNQILANIDGSFGESSRTYRHRADQQRGSHNQIRIPPEYIASRNRVAVVDNPSAHRGILDVMKTAGKSDIHLFHWNGDELGESVRLGPMNGRILDLEVSHANPDQLLWLRQSPAGPVFLEMVDFGRP